MCQGGPTPQTHSVLLMICVPVCVCVYTQNDADLGGPIKNFNWGRES